MTFRISILLCLAGLFQFAMGQNSESSGLSRQVAGFPVGTITRADIQTGWFGDYFMKEYASYEPDPEVIEKLKIHAYSHRIVIVMAFWCSDSQQQVPRFYKILDRLRYNYNMIELISVDRGKLAGDIDITNLGIERVPTFIFLSAGHETGRIIETPDLSLEEDALTIFSR